MTTRIVGNLVPIAVATILAGAACGQAGTTGGGGGNVGAPGSSTAASAAPAESPTAASANPSAMADLPADEPAAGATEHRVTYDWATPSDQVTIEHAAEAPTPNLVAIYTGDHPEEDRPYQRIAFYFRDGFPQYNLQYVPSVVGEGTGEPIALDGNAFLRIGFVNAQAHDDAGESTVAQAPPQSIGLQNLKSYGFAGDFEGHVTYGLGLEVAPNSDQVLHVRAGELTKPDGDGGSYHVVYVDIETG
ncbi:MAG TPA: hypothetical protein VHI11_02515 [Jiangellaceae bacterium]|nr:hypothetical protein [Jiangellaceae bacterium]